MSDAAVHGLAGAGGGIIATVVTYPLQAVNTQQQTELHLKDRQEQHGSVGSSRAPPRADPQGTVQRVKEVLKRDGVGALYRGLLPSLIGTSCSQGVYYYFYQSLRNVVEARAKKRALAAGKGRVGAGSIGTLEALVIAAIAGCINVLLTNPVWVIVTRMQTNTRARSRALEAPGGSSSLGTPQATRTVTVTKREAGVAGVAGGLTASPRTSSTSSGDSGTRGGGKGEKLAAVVAGERALPGLFETAVDLYQEAGLLGFWKGVVPTLMMVSNPSIQFMIYETLLGKLRRYRVRTAKGSQVAGQSAWETFVMGSIAKLGATVVTYPLLVVKARLQAKHVVGASGPGAAYSGTADALLKMVKTEGVASLYRGMNTKIVQSIMASAILFMSKEELVKAARHVLKQHASSLKKS